MKLTDQEIRVIVNRVLCELPQCDAFRGACPHEAMDFARQIEHAVLRANGLAVSK